MKQKRYLIYLIIFTVMLMPAVTPACSYAVKAKESIRFTNISSGRVFRPDETFQTKYKIKGETVKGKPVDYTSSNQSVATIDKNGKITAHKNGKVNITVRVASKKKVKQTISVYVGKRMSSITLSGSIHIRPGRKSKLKAEIFPEDAANRSLSWSTGKKSVAQVTSGTVKGKKKGKAKITAKAKDGSATKGSIVVTVFTLKRNETKWVAHRGECRKKTENTAAAFRQAGKDKFWASECDVWETKTGPMLDENGQEIQDFDIVINHDPTFERVWDVNQNIKDMTAQEIRETPGLEDVCFLQEFLDICVEYNMVPSIELKDPELSQAAIERIVHQVYQTGYNTYVKKALAGRDTDGEPVEGEPASEPEYDKEAADAAGKALLQKTLFVSFYPDLAIRTRNFAGKTYKIIPDTSLIIGAKEYKGDMSELEYAKKNGFTAVSLKKELISQEYSDYCKNNGLQIHAWTYSNNLTSDEYLYQQIKMKQFTIESFTINGKLFE